MSQSIWRRLFPDEPHHMDAFRRAVDTQATPGTTLLDLGCGDNASFAQLRSKGRTVWGVDFQRHPHLTDQRFFRIMPTDGTIPFDSETFDLVTAVWVLEHVQDPAAFLAEVRRVLRPGGVFIGHSINGDHYVAWLRTAMDAFPHSATQWLVQRLYGRAPHDTFPTCYRLNSKRQLQRAARDTGLEMVDLRRYADAGYFGFSKWTHALASFADWALEKLAPSAGRIYFTVSLQRPRQAAVATRKAA